MGAVLFYVHDPMCSWCWAFRPTWLRIVEALPETINYRLLLGGLAPDSGEAMPIELQQRLEDTWRAIERRVPGTVFNFAFWRQCRPRRSTYPACRAVIAARKQGKEFEEPMILGVQQAYYLQARNPSDDETLIAIAETLDLALPRFATDLNSATTQAQLEQEIRWGQLIGARGFPSLVLETAAGYRLLDYDYLDPGVVLDRLENGV
ncbi:MAG: DsbA family protein [Gammaproteobacteria bacterium]|nr:DsbA family protein [Gammaproteobacteria bacterium]